MLVVMPALPPDALHSRHLTVMDDLCRRGAVALMNSRTGGRLDAEEGSFVDPRYAPESGYVTIGAGSRAIAGTEARLAYNRDEEVEGAAAYVVLSRRTLASPGSAEVVHPGIARLQYDNSEFNYTVPIGMLGTALHAAGLKTAVVGNSDAESLHREIATICMDDCGRVDYGNVGKSLAMQDARSPLGTRTNAEQLLADVKRCLALADLVVVELGDLARVERSRLDTFDAAYQDRLKDVLTSSDELLGQIVGTVDLRKTVLMVLSPYPPSYVVERTGNSLCPIVVAGAGIQHGLLTSGSTRVAGVIANTDLAPTILGWLGVATPTGLVGRATFVTPHREPAEIISRLDSRISSQTTIQPVVRQVVWVAFVLVCLVFGFLTLRPTNRFVVSALLPTAALIPPALFPATLVLALLPIRSELAAWVGLIFICAVLVAIARVAARSHLEALMFVSLLFPVMVMADLISGGSLCRYSILGYSIVDGSRYYGIGNEYMGALIGSSIVGLGLMMWASRVERRTMQITFLVAVVIGTVVVGAPVLGANTGGAISAVVAFGLAVMAAYKKPLDARRMAIISMGVVLVLAAFAILDSLRGQQYESHLGKAVRMIATDGLSQMGMLMKRKLAMNFLLIRVSAWSRLLLAYALTVVFLPRLGGTKTESVSLPLHLRVTLVGVVSGTLAALAFNDSGVVAAATCFTYAWALMILLALRPSDIPGERAE